jgi:hypothetical protein
MHKIVIPFLIIALSACSPTKKENEDASASASTDSITTHTTDSLDANQTSNKITDTEKREGWKLLFDGTSLQGWRTFKNLPNDSWEVSDGTLHCKAFKDQGENKRADLMTEEQYENFELAFDWKISPQGNSGVIFRVSEKYDQPYASGPEYQLIDDTGTPGDLKEVQFTGANYDMHVASKTKKLNPIGEWNTSKLLVNKNHVEHWLNGEKVLEYELHSKDWNDRKAKSKWKDFPGYGMSNKGHIDLQDHSNEVWFRNIKVRTL